MGRNRCQGTCPAWVGLGHAMEPSPDTCTLSRLLVVTRKRLSGHKGFTLVGATSMMDAVWKGHKGGCFSASPHHFFFFLLPFFLFSHTLSTLLHSTPLLSLLHHVLHSRQRRLGLFHSQHPLRHHLHRRNCKSLAASEHAPIRVYPCLHTDPNRD